MSEKWTKEMEWNELARAAVILGIVPDCSIGSMHAVSDMLKARINQQLVRKRKEGDWQSAPAWYQGKFEE